MGDLISAAAPVIVRPSAPALTAAGRWIGYLALPWALVAMLGGSWLLGLGGYPSGDTPVPLRFLLLAFALAPLVVWIASSSRLGQLPGLRRLRATPQPLAIIDSNGIELSLPEYGVRRFDWEAVSRLDVIPDWFHQDARLIGTNGSTLAVIPESLVHGRSSWRALWVETLAKWVVAVRPDRYAISGTNWAGLPNAFALIDTATGNRPEVGERRRSRVLASIVTLLIAMTVIAGALWALSQS